MLKIPVGHDAVVALQFADDDGNAVTPTAASYQVLDGEGATLVYPTNIADVSTPPTITIPASNNADVGPRSIMLTMTTGAGVIVSETVYAVMPVARLVPLQNSFQTYAQATFSALNMRGVEDFTGAPKDDQIIGLIEAFRRLTNLNYSVRWPELVDVQNYLNPRFAAEITPLMWPNMTPELFADYPLAWRQALCQAQIAEAAEILKGEEVDASQASGLLAWSVGESKMMFKSGVAPLRRVNGVSRPALEYLKGWLNNRLTITRSS